MPGDAAGGAAATDRQRAAIVRGFEGDAKYFETELKSGCVRDDRRISIFRSRAA
ncbi:hypothetical protein G3N57_32215 [Paraburkholderia sp. Se-20369]|nr:hypothetical protein [Paraburkholderia sp. Se-20369]